MHFYNTNRADLEAPESFFLRLSGQPAICGWSVEVEKGDIREIFIAKMKVNDIQKDSCIRPEILQRKPSDPNFHRKQVTQQRQTHEISLEKI